LNGREGNLDGEAQNYQINSNDLNCSPEMTSRCIVAYTNGAAVTLSDVSKISDGVENFRLADG